MQRETSGKPVSKTCFPQDLQRQYIYREIYIYIYIYIFLKGPMFLRVTQCSCGHVLTVGPPEPFDPQRSGEMRSRNFGQLVDRVEGHECQTGLGHKC